MLYEWRTYHFAPGAALRYLDAFKDEGLPLVTRHLPLLGYWLTEFGRLNVLHHLWVYDDFADRAACRRALAADTDWTEGFGPRAFPMIAAQETLLLTREVSSPELDAAVAGARAVRDAPSGAPLSERWALLEYGERTRDDAAVTGSWRIDAGEHPGRALTLLGAVDTPETLLAGAPASRRELMRPCSFSPLG